MSPYLWDYIKDSDYRDGNPYSNRRYYADEEHIADVYPEAYGFDGKPDSIYPELFLSEQEMDEGRQITKMAKGPIVTLQISGGKVPGRTDPYKMPSRDLKVEFAQKIANIAFEKGFAVLQIKLPDELQLKNVQAFNMPFRKYLPLIPFIKGHIGIDSSFMHAVAAFQKPAFIFWGGTKIKNLGYPYMTNVVQGRCPTPMCGRPMFGIPDFEPEGPWKCKYNYGCMDYPDSYLKGIGEFLDKLLEVKDDKLDSIEIEDNKAIDIMENREIQPRINCCKVPAEEGQVGHEGLQSSPCEDCRLATESKPERILPTD
jgi:hypothetical protein